MLWSFDRRLKVCTAGSVLISVDLKQQFKKGERGTPIRETGVQDAGFTTEPESPPFSDA